MNWTSRCARVWWISALLCWIIASTATAAERGRNDFETLRAAGAIYEDASIVSDDRIITCRGPGQALEVALRVLDAVIGERASADVRRYMVADERGRGVLSEQVGTLLP